MAELLPKIYQYYNLFIRIAPPKVKNKITLTKALVVKNAAFKRLKSLLQLGHLKKLDAQGAKAWLQGKLLVACLIETFILTAERFSPWGYLGPEEAATAQALALA